MWNVENDIVFFDGHLSSQWFFVSQTWSIVRILLRIIIFNRTNRNVASSSITDVLISPMSRLSTSSSTMSFSSLTNSKSGNQRPVMFLSDFHLKTNNWKKIFPSRIDQISHIRPINYPCRTKTLTYFQQQTYFYHYRHHRTVVQLSRQSKIFPQQWTIMIYNEYHIHGCSCHHHRPLEL